MLRQVVTSFLRRASDVVYLGRFKSRIVLGSDRKDLISSGYGDGGREQQDSSCVDIVSGFDGQNVDYENDRSRIYISEKTDPDSYFSVSKGPTQTASPAIVQKSDNVYIISRKNIKILNDNFSIIVREDGNAEVESSSSISIKCGNSTITISPTGGISIDSGDSISLSAGSAELELSRDGSVSLGRAGGIPARIITELDSAVVTPPTPGSPQLALFTPSPPSVIQNQNVKIKI